MNYNEALTALRADGNKDWRFWQEVATALADHITNPPEQIGVVKESLTTEAKLSRFLPKMPDDLPDLPEGCLYVGKGRFENTGKSVSNYLFSSMIGSCWGPRWNGNDGNAYYAVRIDAPADIWARFGLMPYEELFFEHVPGDPMPFDSGFSVDVVWEDGVINRDVTFNLAIQISTHHQIIGWRPADWQERREKAREVNA